MGLFKKRTREDNQQDMTTSKIYIFFDWVWKLFVINTLTLVTCIGIITIFPAITSGFRTIKECMEEDQTHYIRAYYRNFAFCFRDTVVVGIIMTLVYALLFYSYIYYSELIDSLAESGEYVGWLNIYSLLLSFTIVLTLFISFIFMQMPMVVTYFHLRFIDKIRLAFYAGFKHMGITLAELLVIIGNVALLIVAPIWAFVYGLSIPLYLFFIFSRRMYWALAHRIDYDEDEEDKYDIQNKKQNREDYEDADAAKINAAVEELEKINKKISED